MIITGIWIVSGRFIIISFYKWFIGLNAEERVRETKLAKETDIIKASSVQEN
jgi:hypothetical protein